MAVVRETAVYREKDAITEFIGNPLIAALPESRSQDEMLRDLLKLPPLQEQDRNAERSVRLDLLSRLSTIHIPFVQDLFIARSLSRCINWGYVSRNPVPFDVTAQVLKDRQIELTPELNNYLRRAVFPIYGFSVIGISGVGKTSSVLNALTCYPQVIDHTEYNGVPFRCAQLVWLKVDCPGDGSQRGLCTAILRQIDVVLGTHYSSEVSARISKDFITSKVSQCLSSHHLGVIIIDDIQNLVGAKKDTTSDMLSFLIYLMETLAIPVVMVGTPKVLKLFQQEFQLAKRATGDGTVRMSLLPQDSNEWERFIRTIWRYQFLPQEVSLTSEMNAAFYRESVGNPFLCSLLYKLVQDDAITSGDEIFTPEDVRKVAAEKLGITSKMRTNMLNGSDEELRQYEYLWQAAQMPPEINEEALASVVPTVSKKEELAASITSELARRFGINVAKAAKVAKESIAAKGYENPTEVLGFALKLCETALKSSEDSSSNQEEHEADGAADDQ